MKMIRNLIMLTLITVIIMISCESDEEIEGACEVITDGSYDTFQRCYIVKNDDDCQDHKTERSDTPIFQEGKTCPEIGYPEKCDENYYKSDCDD